jgi:phospholipid/cholesterol/gamma-HCH transport system substrate-binding protein
VNRGLVARMIALVVISILGVYFVVFESVGVKIFNTPFTVKVTLPNAGGIYTDASVTYRGVTVGKVTAVHLEPNDVVVDLAIRRGEKIPSNVTASVRELTAAAEQYMDLVPASTDPPYLHSGSVIPESHTSVPVTVGELLNNLNSLVNSLHASDLNTLSQALAQGLHDAGPDLRAIIVDGNLLLNALRASIPGTNELIQSGHTVLSAFNDTSANFASFNHNLNLLTRQVAQSNGDLLALLQNGSTASAALNQFLTSYGNPTVALIDDLATVTDATPEPAFRALFQVLPVLASDAASVTGPNGQIRFELDFNLNNTVCPYTSTMAEPTTLVALADLSRNCGIQAPDLLQRGADKAPAP